jgi:hypothetical protein
MTWMKAPNCRQLPLSTLKLRPLRVVVVWFAVVPRLRGVRRVRLRARPPLKVTPALPLKKFDLSRPGANRPGAFAWNPYEHHSRRSEAAP